MRTYNGRPPISCSTPALYVRFHPKAKQPPFHTLSTHQL